MSFKEVGLVDGSGVASVGGADGTTDGEGVVAFVVATDGLVDGELEGCSVGNPNTSKFIDLSG